MAISQRVFGSDLDPAVKEKLEAKQNIQIRMRDNTHKMENRDGTEISPGEAITTDFPYGETSSIADLSSRTPFIRMWCAVAEYERTPDKIIDGDQIIRFTNLDSYIDFINNPGNYPKGTKQEDFYAEAEKQAMNTAKKFGTSYHPYPYENPEPGTFAAKINHEKIADQIYVIGNHVYNELTAVKKTKSGTYAGGKNSQLFAQEEVSGLRSSSTRVDSYMNPNEFLRPAAGITGMSSVNEDMLGVIRRTTINFKVNNFHDFENIYQTYFLKPGAQLFVDFGWSSSNLYRPRKLIDAYNPEGFLYCESDVDPENCDKDEETLAAVNGVITEAAGDMETLIGVVTNYTSNIQPDGTIDCEVELISKNASLTGSNFDSSAGSLYNRVCFQLEINGLRNALIEQYRNAGLSYDKLLTWKPKLNLKDWVDNEIQK